MVMVKLFAVMMLGSHAAETDGKRAVERRKEPHHNSGSDHRYDCDHGKENRVFKGSHIGSRPIISFQLAWQSLLSLALV